MNEPLHPSTLGEILDRTVQLYRRNFWMFAGTAALPVAVILALGAFAGILVVMVPGISSAGLGASAAVGAIAIVGVLVAVPIYLAAYVFSIAGLTQAAVSAHGGEKLTIRAALASAKPRFLTYLWYLILQCIVAALIPAAGAAAIIGVLVYFATVSGGGIASNIAIGFLALLVGLAALVVIAWLLLSYAMGMAVCVVEKKTAWESLQRAASLSKGTRGRIFVMFLLVMVLSMAVSMASYFIFALVVAVVTAIGNGAQSTVIAAAIGAIVQFVLSFSLQMILAPVSWISLVLFYYDQRIRTEGYDIEMMMAQAGMTQLPTSASPARLGLISAPAPPPDTVEER
jgi:hypothetical protein